MMRYERRPLLVVLAALLLSACGAGEPEWGAASTSSDDYRGMVLPRPLQKVDFTLNDTEGEPFHFRAETDGYLTLLFFGFTNCPDVCPVHLANLAAVLDGLPVQTRNRIKVVFVTVDPERDTPQRIREWLDAFNRGYIGLRGTREEVDAIMTALQLPTAVIDTTGGKYEVGHPSQIIAFQPDNVARVIYPFGTRQADWAYDLPRLVADAGAIQVSTAYVAEPITGDRTALYFTIENQGSVDDALISVKSPVARRVEIHRTTHSGGIARMQQISRVEVRANGRVRLAPGGLHIMLLDLERSPEVGEIVEAELEFLRAGRMRIEAEVRPYAELESLVGQDPAQAGEGG